MPSRAKPLTVVGMIVSVLMLSACVSNQKRINQFAQFAETGSAYTQSIDGLLDASLATTIQADNQVLILGRKLNPDGTTRTNDLKRLDEETKARAIVHEQIRVQLHLLQDYFAALAILASSDEDGAVANATSGISDSTKALVERLGTLSDDIAKAKIGKKSVGDFLADSVEPVVAAYRRAALDRTLNDTAETVAHSLSVHRATLEAIHAQMTADLGLIFDKTHSETVSGPFIGKGDLPNNWGELRAQSLMRQVQIVQVDEAIAASNKLELAFQALVEKRADGPSFSGLMRDLDQLVDFAKQLT